MMTEMMILIEVDDGYRQSKGRIISLVKRVITCWKEEAFFGIFSKRNDDMHRDLLRKTLPQRELHG